MSKYDHQIPDDVLTELSKLVKDVQVEEVIRAEDMPFWHNVLGDLDRKFEGWRSEKAIRFVHLMWRYHCTVESFQPLSIVNRNGDKCNGSFVHAFVDWCNEQDNMPFSC